MGESDTPSNASLMLAQTVVSVGPYALISRLPFDQRAMTSAEHASPAAITVASGTSSDNSASRAGGNVACVIF